MLRDDIRICDICEDEIPNGTTYRRATMPPEAAALLAATDDPDIRATWTVNSGGTVSMDICATCTLSMGQVPGKEQIN